MPTNNLNTPRKVYLVNGIPAQEDEQGKFDFTQVYQGIDQKHHWYIETLEFLLHRPERPPTQPDILYFLYSSNTGVMKLGITRNLQERKVFLERSHGFPLKVLHTIITPRARDCEQKLLQHWGKYRLEGEWLRFPTRFTPGRIVAAANKVLSSILLGGDEPS
jgi:hypothetical protein